MDAEVQREETRLVNVEALAGLRGGLGESYRQSQQAILADAPEGHTFPQVVEALRARQGHAVHRGTILALLSASGFVQHDGRWFMAADTSASARGLRTALVVSLVPPEDAETLRRPPSDPRRLQAMARAIQTRLRALLHLVGADKGD